LDCGGRDAAFSLRGAFWISNATAVMVEARHPSQSGSAAKKSGVVAAAVQSGFAVLRIASTSIDYRGERICDL
jgi:hypothetical protein